MNQPDLISICKALPFPAAVIQKYNLSSFFILEANLPFLEKNGLEDVRGLDIITSKLPLLNLLNNKQEASFLRLIQKALKEHQPQSFTISRGNKNGPDVLNPPFRFCEIWPLAESNLLMLSFHDIPYNSKQLSNSKNYQELKQTNEQLNIQNSEWANKYLLKNIQYEAADKELNDFMYAVSHDLRAPLRRIDGFSQELINEYSGQLDETGIHYLSRIRHGAQDMGMLIDDLLKLSRLSRQKVHPEKFDLADLARDVLNYLKELDSPDQEIQFNIRDEIMVTADKGLVRVLLINLLSNALKFSSQKKTIHITLGTKEIKGQKVIFLSDNGIGFKNSFAEDLFKAFHRLHSQQEFPGSGIGLATVKRIVKLHGGTIWGESTEGKGATFYFKLSGD